MHVHDKKTFSPPASRSQSQVGSTLQVRGCQLNMQQTMLNCLETFLGNLGLLDFEIPLLPEVPDCAWALSCFAATHDIQLWLFLSARPLGVQRPGC